MKKFLKSLLYFLLLWCVVNFIVYRLIVYPEVYQEYEIRYSDAELESFNKYIMADSRGWRLTKGNPTVEAKLKANKTLNLSYGSDSYFDILFKLKYLLAKGITLDTLYISADEHMISKYRLKANNRYRSIKMADYKTYSAFFKITRAEFVIRKYLLPYFPLIKPDNSKLIREYLYSKIRHDNRAKNEIKWAMIPEKEKNARCHTRFDSHFPDNYFSVKLCNALKSIIQLARDNNIKVVGVKFPVAPNYLELLNHLPFHSLTVFNTYNVKVLDFQSIMDNDNYFSNQDHVNRIGALRVAEIMFENEKK